MPLEGITNKGDYRSRDGKHKDLTAEEVAAAVAQAKKGVPHFHPPHNAGWEDHHPVMREVWEAMGITPEKVAARNKQIADLEKKLAELKATPLS